MLLSLVHLLKFNSYSHLVFVKVLFSLVTVIGFFIFLKFVAKLTETPDTPLRLNIMAALFTLASPTFLSYFFSVRSDQVACVLFSVFLYLTYQKNLKWAVATLLLIPLFGVKELIFLIPGFIYLIWTFKDRFTKLTIFWLGLLSSALLIWIVNLNFPALFYLLYTFEVTNYAERFRTSYFRNEAFLLTASLLISIFILLTKRTQYYKIAVTSLCFTALLVALPQSFYFFMASLLPFIYLPAIAMLISLKINNWIKVSIISAQILFVAVNNFTGILSFDSVQPQLKFVTVASKLIRKNKFTYIDGMGILPRERFYPCFVSPNDNFAKERCLKPSFKPDVVIITNRFASLGDQVFEYVKNDYTQLFPNFWVLNTSINEKIKAQINLELDQKNLPIFIF